MIRLRRGPAPARLTCRACDEERERLISDTEAAIEAGEVLPKIEAKSNFYNGTGVKLTLSDLQYNKCCYCETNIKPASYGDIEHFRPKSRYQQRPSDPKQLGYYWLAYTWDNLMLSCTVCNTSYKKTLFPLADEAQRARSHRDDLANESPQLINPFEQNPFIHIYFVGSSARHKTVEGHYTISILGLNRAQLLSARTDIIRRLTAFADMCISSDLYPHDIMTLFKNACIGTEPYTAACRDLLARRYPHIYDMLDLPPHPAYAQHTI